MSLTASVFSYGSIHPEVPTLALAMTEDGLAMMGDDLAMMEDDLAIMEDDQAMMDDDLYVFPIGRKKNWEHS